MTIGATTVKSSTYTGNGATVSFSFGFHLDDYGDVEAEDQIEVILLTVATGAETTLTRTTHYTVSINADQSASPGGSITTVSTYSSAYKLIIRLAPSFLQKTDYQNQGGFLMEVVEDQADQQARQILVLKDQLARTPRVSSFAPSWTGEMAGVPAAGQVPVVNPGATGFILGSPVSATVHADWVAALAQGEVAALSVADKTALKALTGGIVDAVFVHARSTAGDGGHGQFRWSSSNLQTECTADSLEAIYVPPTGQNGSAGAWVRTYTPYQIHVAWFGSLSSGSSFTAALQAAIALFTGVGGVLHIPGGNFTLNSSTTLKRGITLKGAGRGVTVIARSSAAQLIVGAGTSQRDIWVEDIQFNDETSVTTPFLVFDRVSYSGARRLLIANVYNGAVDIGTASNPSGATAIFLDDVLVNLQGTSAFGVGIWGGGGIWLQNFNAQGGGGLQQAWMEMHNTETVDGVYATGAFGGTGDCDYGFKWIGSASFNNGKFHPAPLDRCARGAIYLAPTDGGAHPSIVNVEFADGHYGTHDGGASLANPCVYFNMPASCVADQIVINGEMGDCRAEGVVFAGSGTYGDIDLSGLHMRDGGRAAANTYSGIHDTTASGVLFRMNHGSIRAFASSHKYGIEIDNVNASMRLSDLLDVWIEGAATGDIKFGSAVLKAHQGNAGKKWEDIASASTTNLAVATGDYGDITGTTTVTALGTAPAGIVREATFTGALTLTHNATSLILPGAADIVTTAGAVARFRSLGSGNWKCVSYTTAQRPYSGGAFTPEITCATPGDLSVSYSLATGSYRRVGEMVYVELLLGFTPTFTTASGEFRVTGLPFATANEVINQSLAIANMNSAWTWPASKTHVLAVPVQNQSYAKLRALASAANNAEFTMSNLTSGVSHSLFMSGWYRASP